MVLLGFGGKICNKSCGIKDYGYINLDLASFGKGLCIIQGEKD